jgi:hypothetical protein
VEQGVVDAAAPIVLIGRLLEEGIQIIGIELYYKFHKEITNDEVQYRSH